MTRNAAETLEDILTRFVDEVAAPTRQATLAFADRFPVFKHEILRFSVVWAEQEVLPEAEGLSPAMVADLSSKLSVQVREQLARAGAPVMPRVRGLSLNSMCVAVGRSLHELADACGLDLMLARTELNTHAAHEADRGFYRCARRPSSPGLVAAAAAAQARFQRAAPRALDEFCSREIRGCCREFDIIAGVTGSLDRVAGLSPPRRSAASSIKVTQSVKHLILRWHAD